MGRRLGDLKVGARRFRRGGLLRGGYGSPSSDGASADAFVIVLVFLILVVVLYVCVADPALLESLDGSLDVVELGQHVLVLGCVKLLYFHKLALEKGDKDRVRLCGCGKDMDERGRLDVVAGVELLLELVNASLE